MMSLILVMLGLIWVFQIYFLENQYSDKYIEQVREEIASTLNNRENTIEDIKNQIMMISYRSNAVVEVYDYNGKDIFSIEQASNGNGYRHGNGGMGKKIDKLKEESFESALGGKTTKTILHHPKLPIENAMISMKNDYREWIIFLTIPIGSVDSTVEVLKSQLIYIILGVLVISIVITMILSRGFTRPLKEITKASEEISKGNFNINVKVKENDEIGKLAESINNMAVELNKAEELKRDIIGNVSHELKSPLGLIKGYTQMIRDVSINDPIKREKHFEIVENEVDRLSKIVDDILSLSKIQSGNISINLEPVNIVEIMKKNAEKFTVMSEKLGIPINVKYKNELKVMCDKGRLEQIVFNLLNNAFNNTENGSITIDIEEKTESVRINISDTGKGIKEDELDYIWDKFFTAKKTGKEKIYGTGLGLSIVRSIFEACNVKYGVNSKVNAGTTFWFELEKA